MTIGRPLPSVDDLPFLGAGLNYQPRLHDRYLDHAGEIDFLELPTDVFLRRFPGCLGELRALTARFPVVAHGIHLALGDAAPYRIEYLDRLQPLLDVIGPAWFSDHLDMGNFPDEEDGHLAHGVPVPFTAEQVDVFARNIGAVTVRVGRPLLVENIFYEYVVPLASRMPEPAFVAAVLDAGRCGLLLDLTNLQINAANFGFDPYEWLAAAPVERTVELHVAGSERRPSGPHAGRWYDTHSQPVPDEVWTMVEYVVARAPVKAIVVERNNNDPPMPELMAELRIARQLVEPAPSRR